ncbi:MAG: hypothetical protein A2487_09155 [Candidatus Raymondbacteria bacterium RifOxyC12_full_50_8]|uniref:Uncharacterized protein n=1 Tax=Candidatus Raymondbacteria bacterium RIFOXYD12_FULL_49_13 TaxID=1817890 RepID=A0A1F7FFZ7_UNCRA|nr:MAG: hypothetical protein A2248_22785 [Candidatus Raymondbacteria bacterium RIFOXYA2_FULL_49_16]OGJ94587.1 MAG: hypothetical protein A2350_05885 [Candidatus Raymondbacteria bacterium RifOxyB12_full_50_8]OGJ98857.1 MAG: hypothetical protein A2487_09155 [Candidatus Raymondbacteria bacterium RifOxyC12_full_50_8]OGK05392.1 MAG: hypothetical protein A2519_03735 [Candidatus Raymondbacteria bacterium RIFOXYD12_FULL_49_13]OGP43005.1 MAG: hypothetical protein A2324_16440 [Candidatus Raymondbacteria b
MQEAKEQSDISVTRHCITKAYPDKNVRLLPLQGGVSGFCGGFSIIPLVLDGKKKQKNRIIH